MRAAAAALAALLLAGCAGEETGPTQGSTGGSTDTGAASGSGDAGASGAAPRLSLDAPEAGDGAGTAEAPAADPAGTATTARYQPRDLPAIWIDVDRQGGGEASVIFAIDTDYDNSVADEGALRITPQPTAEQAGDCGLDELERHAFSTEGPVFSYVQANQGVRPAEMPRFLAYYASQLLIRQGLATDVEDTVPQNICTRKYWQLWLSQVEPIEPGVASGGDTAG
ncbi:MAG: hypothetical protein ACFBWO_08965 [Paracoccaceae bacterium]